jgi:hypothetical protein
MLNSRGCGQILGLVYDVSPRLSRFDGAERAQGDLDPFLVVPADVGVHGFNELHNSDASPVPRVKQFGLQPTEEASAGRVVR